MPSIGEAVEAIEVVELRDGSVAVADLAEWVPKIHLLGPSAAGGTISVPELLFALGGVVGRERTLQIRELESMRLQMAAATSSRRIPTSVRIVADLRAGGAIAAGLRDLLNRHIGCEVVAIWTDEVPDVRLMETTVRAIYDAGYYRLRLEVMAEHLVNVAVRRRLASALLETWSVQPVVRLRWGANGVEALREPTWRETAAQLVVSGYSQASPHEVWTFLRETGCEIGAFEINGESEVADVGWLVAAYDSDLVVAPERCSPYREVIDALRGPRLPCPRCIRGSSRQLLVSADGTARCCGNAVPKSRWIDALTDDEVRRCSTSWIGRNARHCCSGGALTATDCSGTSDVGGCPQTLCTFASALLPVLLERWRRTMVIG